MTVRIQLSRKRGYRKPAGAIVVSRPTKCGNPFKVGFVFPTKEALIAGYRSYLAEHPEKIAAARRELRGRDLACWCQLPAAGEPDLCHAAVLLEVANS